jgi:hypothetical protein
MGDFQKPRHIRDIAHLFISRSAAKDSAPARRVYVVAVSRECFGAYHAANLALGFGRKDYAVELLEVSGVLPCSAYFLRLPPRVYIRHKVRSPHEALSALGRISIRFSLPGDRENADVAATGIEVGPRRRSAGAVEVYHLPPMCDLDSLERVLAETVELGDTTATSSASGRVRAKAVVLAPRESEARKAARRLFQNRTAVDWSTLSLDDRFGGSVGSSSSRRCLGYLAGWRSLLSDPLPCVVRDPGSHVSRSYLSVCDALLSPGSSEEEKHDNRRSRRAASLGQFR